MFRVPRRRRRCAPPPRSSASTPTASCTTTFPAWTTTTCAAASPTVHVKWDEATAVLAGDALQTLAFEILAGPQGGIDPRLQTRLILRLAQAAGAMGMVGGQALDMAAESAAVPLDLGHVADLQALKTGSLFVWAAESGAILGRSDPEPLRRYGAALGLAYQLADDLLDVEGDAEAAGKRLQQGRGRGQGDLRLAPRRRRRPQPGARASRRAPVTRSPPTARPPRTCARPRASSWTAAGERTPSGHPAARPGRGSRRTSSACRSPSCASSPTSCAPRPSPPSRSPAATSAPASASSSSPSPSTPSSTRRATR